MTGDDAAASSSHGYQPLPSRFAGPERSPGFLLWRTTNAWQRHLRQALAPLGLTHVQFVLLASACWLAANAESTPPLTQRMLAVHAQADEMMTSQTLRALEGKGLLDRIPHPTDGRARCVVPTPAGRALAARAIVVVEDADAQFFAVLENDAGGFANALARLASVPLSGPWA